jgi:hypothetical protein
MKGLDNRHQDKNKQIEKKHGNTKLENLATKNAGLRAYLNKYKTLGQLERHFNTDSYDGVKKAIRNRRKSGGK